MKDPLEDFLSQNKDFADKLKLRVTPYIPHNPTPKQRLFLSLPHKEAFFGGAAGGGKSDALLMGALQYVDRLRIAVREEFRCVHHASRRAAKQRDSGISTVKLE